MTNKEIEKVVADLHLDSICRDDFGSEDLAMVRTDIAEAMRSLVSQAYEEAEQRCVGGAVDIGCSAIEAEGIVRRTREALAADIRALKDSLEPVASSVS
jgi:hypothetical protein